MGTFTIIPRAEWGAAPLKPGVEYSAMTQPDGWVVHYVGGHCTQNPSLETSKALVRRLQADAMANTTEKYIDIPYSFLIDPNGRIFEGRGWANKSGANGSSNYNGHAWAVCVLIGPAEGELGTSKADGNTLTQAAKDSLGWLTREGARRRSAVSYVKGHRDVYATHCPGDQLYAYVPHLHAHLHDPEATADINWTALAALVAWQKRVSKKGGALHVGQRGPDVKILNDLLIAKGYTWLKPSGEAYGDKTVVAVTALKNRFALPSRDGSAAGGDVARVLLS